MAGSKLNFAVSALIEICKSGSNGPIGAREIAGATGLSKRYLELVLGLLTKSGIIKSTRGKHGGYELAMAPEKLHLMDVWMALSEELTIPANKAVLAAPNDGFSGSKAVSSLWIDIHEIVAEYMERQTLRSLALLDLEREGMYYI